MAKAKKAAKPKEEKEKKPAGPGIFQFLEWLTTNKKQWHELPAEAHKAFNIFIVNRFLSMELAYCEAINTLQENVASMSKEMAWRVLYEVIPPRRAFFKYIKAAPIEGISEEEIQMFVTHFKCTDNIAIEYIRLLKRKGLQEEIDSLKNMYNIK